LNQILQDRLNPVSDKSQSSGIPAARLRLNDKVMQIRNNYQKEVFNGDIGILTQVDREDQEVWVRFDEERFVSYDFSELDELTLAYCISVHKSQGSEYPCVVLPVLTSQYVMLQRNLLYTAVTRAKELVVLVGTKKAIAIAVRNNRAAERNTLLKERLQQAEREGQVSMK
jgi:exodeoxyribonuclease V alpha subunit